MKAAPPPHLAAGRQAEYTARRFLERQGLHLVAHNVHAGGGELDLVMQDGDTLVFVEVRYRRSRSFGSAAASVGHTKQLRLRRAAAGYLQTRRGPQAAARFDVISIHGDLQAPEIDWIRDAF